MELSHFDVIAFISETWLSPDIQDDKIMFQNYQKQFRKDRPDDDLHKLFLFFKMNHGLSPLYLSNHLPLHVVELSSYRLRNAENYVGIHANTRAYAESFLPSTLQAWNNLPEAVRSADTLAAFKHLITLDTPKVSTYYDCGDRLDQISHTRLRTECSSLNQHYFRRNLVQNPYCLCGEIEDNKYFLLTWPRHNQIRAEMVLSIQQKQTWN